MGKNCELSYVRGFPENNTAACLSALQVCVCIFQTMHNRTSTVFVCDQCLYKLGILRIIMYCMHVFVVLFLHLFNDNKLNRTTTFRYES